MEERSNLDLELAKLDTTLTFTGGHSPLPGTPSLNKIADIPGMVKMWLVDMGDGEQYLHSKMLAENMHRPSVMKELEQIFLVVMIGLYENGMKEVKTFVDPEHPEQGRFNEFFGFEYNGISKVYTTNTGEEVIRDEMVYRLPLEEGAD